MPTDIRDLYPESSNLAPCVWPDKTRDDRDQLETMLRHHVENSYRTKWPRALNWFRNIAFLNGNQYPVIRWNNSVLTINSANSVLEIPGGATYSIPKTVDNKLIRPHEANMALLIARKPEPRVEPASTSTTDEDIAKVGEVIIGLKWEDLKMRRKMRTTGGLLTTVGNVLVEMKFGETDIPEYKPKAQVRELFNVLKENAEDAETVVEEGDEMELGFREDLQCTVWSGFEFDVDASATEDPDTWSWFFTEQFMDVGQIKELFDRDDDGYYTDRLEDVSPEDGKQSPLYWYAKIKDLVEDPEDASQFASRFSGAEGDAPNQTILRTWTCKPNKHFPQGRTMITAGDILIYSGPSDAWHEKYPERWHRYSRIPFWEVPGSFWACPLLSKIIPHQRRINAIDSLVQINREFMVIGQWLVPRQAKVDPAQLGGISGQVIEYTPTASGAKPERVQHQGLPQELLMERSIMERAIEEISGTNQIGQGENPSGVRAGVMQQFLYEKTLESKTSMIEGVSDGIESIAQNILIEVAINIETIGDDHFSNRIMVAAQEHSRFAIESFKLADLRDNAKVRIDLASALRRSPEAAQQKAIEFYQYSGGNMSPSERSRVAKAIGFDEFMPDQTVHYNRARKLVSYVVGGYIKEVNPLPFALDDPEVFLAVFADEVRSDRMREYPEEVQMVLYQGVAVYRQMYDQMMAQQMQQQMQMQQMLKAGAR